GDFRSAAVVIPRFHPPPGCAATATVVDDATMARGGAEALYRLPGGPLAAAASAKPKFRIEDSYPPLRGALLGAVGGGRTGEAEVPHRGFPPADPAGLHAGRRTGRGRRQRRLTHDVIRPLP